MLHGTVSYCQNERSEPMNDAFHDHYLRSFLQGIACAKAAELPSEEVYDSALCFACNDWNLAPRWLDERLAVYFEVSGYPEVW
jgi:hypothetical protein